MDDRRPLGSRFQDTNKQTREGGGLPESSIIPPGITHDLVLQFDLPARKMEREERLLAFNGGDVNKTLLDICEEGGGKDARFLLAHGADANYHEEGWPVLECAAANNHVAVAEALLDAGCELVESSALVLAAASGPGMMAMIGLLLDRGADVHHQSDYALYCAAGDGTLETVTILLDRGADPNGRGGSGTVRNKARRCGHHEVAALLVARGAIEEEEQDQDN